MLDEPRLHLRRRDVLTASDDEILEPTRQSDVAALAIEPRSPVCNQPALSAGSVRLRVARSSSARIAPATNEFFMSYFMFAGIHLVHVVLGMGVLAVMTGRVIRQPTRTLAFVQGIACYWRMVDLLWIALFALLYLA